MSKQIRNIVKTPCFVAFLFTLPTLLAFLLTEPKLSGAGDMNLAEMLMSGGKIKSGYFFISPLLAGFLRLFCSVVSLNWWSIFSVAIMFTGLFVCIWFIAKRMGGRNIIITILTIELFNLVFWELMLKNEINFTQTSTIAALAGMLILFDFALDKSESKIPIVRFIIAVILLWISGEIRNKAFYLTVPFGLMVTAYCFVFPLNSENFVDSLKASLEKRKKWIIVCAVLLAELVMVFSARKIYNLDDGLKNWYETNKNAEDVNDYGHRYPNYDKETELYDNLGIKKSWLGMVMNHSFSDGNTFSADSLQAMKTIRRESQKKVSDFSQMFSEHRLLWLVLIFWAVVIIHLTGKDKALIPLVGALMGIICCSLFCVYIGRIAWRVTNGYVLCGVIAFMVMCFSNTEDGGEGSKEISLHVRLEYIALLVLTVIIWLAAVKDEKGSLSMPAVRIVNQNQAETLELIDRDDSNVYLYDDLIRFDGAYNVWAGHTPDYLDNYIPLSSCFAFGCRDTLAKYGINDLYHDMCTMKNIRVENQAATTDILIKYLREHYSSDITMSVIDNINGNLYLRYSDHIIPSDEKASDFDCAVSRRNDMDNIENVDAIYEVRIDFKEDISDFDDMFINEYTPNGQTYSYAVNITGNTAGGVILCIQEPELSDTKWQIVGKDKNGTGYAIGDITDTFQRTEYIDE